MRLIDADALDFCFPVTDNLEGMFKQIGIGMAQARVNDAPTIDPEELRPKGRWLLRSKGRTGWVECSNCNTVGHPYWKCCPVCESKMECPEEAPLGGRLVNVKLNMEGGEG